jgi:hypothetical protein
MIPKPVALGPTFPACAPRKGAEGLGALGAGLAEDFADGFAHEVLSAIRPPARPPGKRPNEVPAELSWAVLLGAPPDKLVLPSPSSSSPPRAGTRVEASERGNLPRPAPPAEDRPDKPATRLMREVRRDWVALPMPETGPAPEVSWVQQEPGAPEPELSTEPTPEPPLEAQPVEVTEEPLLDSPLERSPPQATPAARAAPVAEPRSPFEPLEPPVPELEPLPPAFERESVRIRVDSQLAVEVTTRGRHVDVLISGSAPAIEPLKHLGPELGSQLLQDGYSLDDFEARDDGRGEQPSEEQEREQPPVRPVRPRRSARSGRYA